MNKNTNTKPVKGVSFLDLLGLLFIGLKLTGYIDWSWLWVTAPIWGSFVLTLLVVASDYINEHR